MDRTRLAQRRPRRASAEPGEPLRQRRELPPRRPPPDRPRRGRHQVRDDRRRQQRHRPRPRRADVRGRGAGAGRDRACLRPARSRSTPMAPTGSSWRCGLGADSIEHGTVHRRRDPAALQARRGAYYVPTLSTVNGYIERLAQGPERLYRRGQGADRMADRDHRPVAAKAYPAGVKIAFGTDAGVSSTAATPTNSC